MTERRHLLRRWRNSPHLHCRKSSGEDPDRWCERQSAVLPFQPAPYQNRRLCSHAPRLASTALFFPAATSVEPSEEAVLTPPLSCSLSRACQGRLPLFHAITPAQDEINDNQSTQQDSQPKPQSARTSKLQDAASEMFVVLPTHPLYGQRVTIVARRVRTTYVDCTIDALARPSFPYHICECWLSAMAPSSTPRAAPPLSAICIRLSALDKMVQQLLT